MTTALIPRDVLEFMQDHGIPFLTVKFSSMSPQQLEFEKRIFGRKIGGNAWTEEQQFDQAKKTADYWEKVFAGNIEGKKILDVGCGQGYLLHFLQEEGFDVTGLNRSVVESELAAHGIATPAKKMMWTPFERRRVDVADAGKMPYPVATFDGIASYGMLMMAPYTAKVFGQMDRTALGPALDVVSKMGLVAKDGAHLHMVTMGVDIDGKGIPGYLGLDPHSFELYGEDGRIESKGRVGFNDLLARAGFKLNEAKQKSDSNFWNIKATRTARNYESF